MNTLSEKRFAVIGTGNIGSILLERLLTARVPPQNLTVCDADSSRAQHAAEHFGVISIALSDDAIGTVDALLIATPPKTVIDILRELSDRLHAGQLVISFAAAVPLDRLEAALPAVSQIFLVAARGTQEKMENFQNKLMGSQN